MPIATLPDFGRLGVVADSIGSALPVGAWSDARNIRFTGLEMQKALEPSLLVAFDYVTNGDPLWMQGWSDGLSTYIAVATQGKLWFLQRNNPADAGTWVDATRLTGDYQEDGSWDSFAWGDSCIFNNTIDPPQIFNQDTLVFEDLPNWGLVSSASDITTFGPPTIQKAVSCRILRPYKNQLMAFGVTENSVYEPNTVWWSNTTTLATYDPLKFEGGGPPLWDYTSPATISAKTEVGVGSGEITAAWPLNENMVVYTESSSSLVQFVGGQLVMSVRRLFNKGAAGIHCVEEFNNQHFVVSRDQIYIHDGGSTIVLIAKDRVEEEFFERIGKGGRFGGAGNVNWDLIQVVKNPDRKEISIVYNTQRDTTDEEDIDGVPPYPACLVYACGAYEQAIISIAPTVYCTFDFVSNPGNGLTLPNIGTTGLPLLVSNSTQIQWGMSPPTGYNVCAGKYAIEMAPGSTGGISMDGSQSGLSGDGATSRVFTFSRVMSTVPTSYFVRVVHSNGDLIMGTQPGGEYYIDVNAGGYIVNSGLVLGAETFVLTVELTVNGDGNGWWRIWKNYDLVVDAIVDHPTVNLAAIGTITSIYVVATQAIGKIDDLWFKPAAMTDEDIAALKDGWDRNKVTYVDPNPNCPWIPAGMSLWLDAADEDTLTLSGQNVLQWDDKSGNNRHAVAEGPNSFTVLQVGQAGLLGNKAKINNLNVIRSPGVSSRMIWPAPFPTKTIVVVWRWRTPDAYDHPWEMAGDFHGYSPGDRDTPVFGNLGGKKGYNGDIRVSGSYLGLNSGNLLKRTTFHWGEQATLTMDVAETNFTALGHVSADTRNPNVDYMEVLAYDRELTLEEHELIEGYLHWKWGIQYNIAPGHTYENNAPGLPAPTPVVVPPGPLWIPTDMPGGDLLMWLDAGDAGTVTLVSGGVQQIDDKSGNGSHVTAFDATKRPLYDDAGLSTARFTFTNDHLVRAGVSTPSGQFSVFFVAKMTGTVSGINVLMSSATDLGSFNAPNWGVFSQNESMYGRQNQGAELYMSPVPFTHTWPFIYDATWDSASLFTQTRDGGELVSQATAVAVATNWTMNIGWDATSGRPLDGSFQEMLLVRGVVTDELRRKIQGYLAWKWELEAKLPPDHIYRNYAPRN